MKRPWRRWTGRRRHRLENAWQLHPFEVGRQLVAVGHELLPDLPFGLQFVAMGHELLCGVVGGARGRGSVRRSRRRCRRLARVRT